MATGRRKIIVTRIAFIGLGNMGRPMAANLAKAGYVVHGFDLAPFVRDGAAKEGVVIASSAAEALEGAEVMITMLPGGKAFAVELTGHRQVLAHEPDSDVIANI